MLSIQQDLSHRLPPVAECRPPERPQLGDLEDLLDTVAASLAGCEHAGPAIRILTDGLRGVKERVSKSVWTSAIIPAVRRHEVAALLDQCPLTRHARTRPRGYPGDAELLDLIYRHPASQPKLKGTSGVGRAIYDVTIGVSACESVRQRRRIVADKIDEVAAARPGANILSLACGHLREAELSRALAEDGLGSLIALDQDPISLACVEAYSARSGCVLPQRVTVRDIIADKHDLPRFDLIYSAGLYDYLQAPTAARLSRKLFERLNEGGTLFLANFLDGIWEAPYMEACMDWHLIYRSEKEILGFLREIPAAAIAHVAYEADAGGRIGYLEVRRN